MTEWNRAAFSRDDVEDSKRGRPDFDLRGYAAERGLAFLDRGTAAGFRSALPCQEELQSNVLRGTLPGGEHGVLAHEALEIGWSGEDPDWGGTFYGMRVMAKGDFGGILGFVPIVNWFVGSDATATIRLPCTVVGVRVPETAGTLTDLRFDRRRSAPPFSFGNRTKLGELVGEKGWDLYTGERPDPGTVARLAAEPVAGLLRAHTENGLFQAVVWWGTLVVRRNGFLRSPAELDELCRAASLLAGRLREVCRPLAEPQPVDAKLPPPPHRGGIDGSWSKWAVETAERHGLELEDPLAYHRAFPSVPVPGIARIVLRGTIPGLGLPGRIVVHGERDAARVAVVTAAPPGAQPTPPGGLPFREHGARLEIADGLLAVWGITSWTGTAVLDEVERFCAVAAAVIDESQPRDGYFAPRLSGVPNT